MRGASRARTSAAMKTHFEAFAILRTVRAFNRRVLPAAAGLLLAWTGDPSRAQGASGPFEFAHHSIPADLPVYNGYGDYGQTALVDIDRDGKLDFVLGRGATQERRSILYWFRYTAPDQWEQHVLGYDSISDVGACALDVDGDGWPDLVTGGAWYRNPRNPRQQPFERHVFDPDGRKAHDVLAADLDGDGKPEILTLRGNRTPKECKDGLVWYKIPANPAQSWEKHVIGEGIHGAITPLGVADLDGDGDLDIVRGDTWFENANGKATQWLAHSVIPFGRSGPYGVCVRTWIGDLDGDGKSVIVMAEADIPDCKAAIFRKLDTKGLAWSKQELPQSFRYGSLHSLAVADFNGDGRLDILVNEQEELLPDGRKNPRWVIWENQGNRAFVERIILDAKLGGHELQAGDICGTGRIDIVSKIWGPQPWNAAGGKMHADFLENLGPRPASAKP